MATNKDAFSLLEYTSEDNKESLVVYNMRDGAAPEFIQSPNTNKVLELTSVLEKKDPEFVPEKGTFIFRVYRDEEIDTISAAEAERIYDEIKRDVTLSFAKDFPKNHWRKKMRELIEEEDIPKLTKF